MVTGTAFSFWILTSLGMSQIHLQTCFLAHVLHRLFLKRWQKRLVIWCLSELSLRQACATLRMFWWIEIQSSLLELNKTLQLEAGTLHSNCPYPICATYFPAPTFEWRSKSLQPYLSPHSARPTSGAWGLTWGSQVLLGAMARIRREPEHPWATRDWAIPSQWLAYRNLCACPAR